MKYIILNEDSSRALQNEVNKKLKEGYALHGTPFVASTNAGIMFCQAVVHPNKHPFDQEFELPDDLKDFKLF